MALLELHTGMTVDQLFGWIRQNAPHGEQTLQFEILEGSRVFVIIPAGILSLQRKGPNSSSTPANTFLPRLTEAWDKGYTAGHSNAMRQMSDEPNAPRSENPYLSKQVTPGTRAVEEILSPEDEDKPFPPRPEGKIG